MPQIDTFQLLNCSNVLFSVKLTVLYSPNSLIINRIFSCVPVVNSNLITVCQRGDADCYLRPAELLEFVLCLFLETLKNDLQCVYVFLLHEQN